MPAEQLSGTIVVIIIAIGVQGCIMLIIFAKRQITRFALRNRRGPHTSLGQGAPKPLRREMDRCIDYIPYIRHEPKTKSVAPEQTNRSRAMDEFFRLEQDISAHSPHFSRLAGANVRAFLLKCQDGPLMGIDSRTLHMVCDQFEHARHHYDPFTENHLETFMSHLSVLREALGSNPTGQTFTSASEVMKRTAGPRLRNNSKNATHATAVMLASSAGSHREGSAPPGEAV